MYWFEKGLYENPTQNLNKLWWDLVEKYQLLRRPENWDSPHWAAKIHIAHSPAYYHNYLLGDFFACQIKAVLKEKNISQSFGSKKLGQFMKNNIFAHGALYKADEMIKKATGEELSPKYYAKEYIG